ncbi:type VI secretion system tip protein VgrG, partial [Salmonella enterica]|nr:type VI secretion system tip protein VgrG [Salmonella enterica]
AGFGNLAIPRVGQEVIVDFLNGDPDQPIIMGRTYHQDNRSPGSLPGTKTQMTIRSKTYKGSGFNELRFEDATDQEQVYIHAQKDMDTEVLNDRSTKVRHDHTESIGNNQRITVTTGQTVSVGTKKEGGHDQTITVANNRSITVRNDQTLKVTNDRMAGISHDDGLYVKNDRRVTVGGKQEHTTTGDHISLVKGTHSLAVKGDLARKVSGALGIKVRNEIVLESGGKITLKVGSSFVVIHAGGVDIVGPKINLNSGGSPGTPVGTLLPGVLEALMDEDNGQDSGGEGTGDGRGPDDSGEPDDENKANLQSLRFAFPGADSSVKTMSWLIGQPYKISDSKGNVLVSGTIEQSGRLPRVMLDEPDELTLMMGSEEWEVEDLALGNDDTSSDDAAYDDEGYDLVNDPYYGKLEQDEQWPSDADINELLNNYAEG